MARNLKKENLKKLAGITTLNNFKIDLANYIYNPSHDYEYPALIKLIKETETEKQYIRFYYFKYYNGTGEYFTETYSSIKNDNGNSWNITTNHKETKLKDSNRFNLKELIQLAEQTELTIAA